MDAKNGNDDILNPEQVGRQELEVSRPTVLRLYEMEGLPGFVLSRGPRGHRILRFRRSEVRLWLEGRRERRVRRILDGDLYGHRGARR